MQTIRFFILAVLLSAHQAAMGQLRAGDRRLAGLDTLVNRVMSDWHVAGLAVAVVEKDKLLYARGFGYRDYERKLPVTPNTVFSIASCTKAFTAGLIGILAEEKKIDLNKPVRNYFPELAFYSDQLTNYATVKDLLTHRTGLPRHDWLGHAKDPISLDSLIYRIRFLEPSAGFREKLQYCNLMYTALGGFSRKITGNLWEDDLREKILDPLGMTNTSCRISDLTEHANHSKGYTYDNKKFIAGKLGSDGANAAGSINSSVTDMAKWLVTLLNDGRYAGRQIIPSRFVRDATSPQMSAPSRPRSGLPAYPDSYFGDYGYGWNISSYRGHYCVTHSGDLPLFSSTTTFYPTDSLGIVVLVNNFDATIAELVSYHIADKLLALPAKNWNKLILALQQKNNSLSPTSFPVKKPIALPLTHPVADYVGTYHHAAYGTIQIMNRNDSLYATHNEEPIFLAHDRYDVFRAGVPSGRLRFEMNSEGKITSIASSLEPQVNDIIFTKK